MFNLGQILIVRDMVPFKDGLHLRNELVQVDKYNIDAINQDSDLFLELESNQRVEISPIYDLWMQGDRFGTIVSIKDNIRVKMDKAGKVYSYSFRDLIYRGN